MTTLIYKRTHSGDPDPETGAFGNRNCMGKIRGWSFNAVSGIGGVGRQAQRHYLDGRLTWIGVGARKDGDPHCPLVTFDHFLHYGETGPRLRDLAPALATRMYDWNVRVTMDSSFAIQERLDVEKILGRAKAAGPSPARLHAQRADERAGTCARQRKGRTSPRSAREGAARR
jgi:hypothetical protein